MSKKTGTNILNQGAPSENFSFFNQVNDSVHMDVTFSNSKQDKQAVDPNYNPFKQNMLEQIAETRSSSGRSSYLSQKKKVVKRAKWGLTADPSLTNLSDRFASFRESKQRDKLTTEDLELEEIERKRDLKAQEKESARQFYDKVTGPPSEKKQLIKK